MVNLLCEDSTIILNMLYGVGGFTGSVFLVLLCQIVMVRKVLPMDHHKSKYYICAWLEVGGFLFIVLLMLAILLLVYFEMMSLAFNDPYVLFFFVWMSLG